MKGIVLLHCPTVAPPLFYMVSSFWPQSPSSVVASTSTYQEGLSCLPEQQLPAAGGRRLNEDDRAAAFFIRSAAAAAFFVKLLSLELFPTLLPQRSWHSLPRPAGRPVLWPSKCFLFWASGLKRPNVLGARKPAGMAWQHALLYNSKAFRRRTPLKVVFHFRPKKAFLSC